MATRAPPIHQTAPDPPTQTTPPSFHANPIPTPPPPVSAPRKLPIKRRASTIPEDRNPVDDLSDEVAAAHTNPFKLQRIWSESDEIRFLQGLLGCRSQGLVFPRDLNIFFDRFSESVPHPYTRSQLSEKLRRLRNKYRSLASRLSSAASGSDTSRLVQHDRDILHLCTRLWDPAHAETSPFFASSSSVSNKRRLANPRSPQPPPAMPSDSLSPSLPVPLLPPSSNGAETGPKVENPAPSTTKSAGVAKNVLEAKDSRIASLVLDVFDECLQGFRNGGAGGGGIEQRWRELRVLEMEVIAKRLRMSVDGGAAAAPR